MKNWSDPIVDEIHQIRQEIMAEAGGDLDVLVERLMREQEENADRLVDLSTTDSTSKSTTR